MNSAHLPETKKIYTCIYILYTRKIQGLIKNMFSHKILTLHNFARFAGLNKFMQVSHPFFERQVIQPNFRYGF